MSSTKKDVQSQFGRSANAYVNSEIHKLGKDLAKLIAITQLSGDEKLLDVATGGGHTANAFAPLVKEVTALDLTSEMLQAAEKFIKENGHENVTFVKGDAESLPFEEETFDIITCRIAPHHFPNVDAFVSEVYRVLKSDGEFLLDDNVVPENDTYDKFYNTIEKDRDFSHFRAWKKSEWFQKLEAVGFEIEEFHRFEKTFKFEAWCNRMNLADSNKESLNTFICNAEPNIKDKFDIEIKNGRVISFKGEAIVLRASKK